eukprot:PhM_4_TR114/c0_g1_i1/m.11309
MLQEGNNAYSFDIYIYTVQRVPTSTGVDAGPAPALEIKLWQFPELTLMPSPQSASAVTTCRYDYFSGRSCTFQLSPAALAAHLPLSLHFDLKHTSMTHSVASADVVVPAVSTVPLQSSHHTPRGTIVCNTRGTFQINDSNRHPYATVDVGITLVSLGKDTTPLTAAEKQMSTSSGLRGTPTTPTSIMGHGGGGPHYHDAYNAPISSRPTTPGTGRHYGIRVERGLNLHKGAGGPSAPKGSLEHVIKYELLYQLKSVVSQLEGVLRAGVPLHGELDTFPSLAPYVTQSVEAVRALTTSSNVISQGIMSNSLPPTPRQPPAFNPQQQVLIHGASPTIPSLSLHQLTEASTPNKIQQLQPQPQHVTAPAQAPAPQAQAQSAAPVPTTQAPAQATATQVTVQAQAPATATTQAPVAQAPAQSAPAQTPAPAPAQP